MFFNFFRKKGWSSPVKNPWRAEEESIYHFIQRHQKRGDFGLENSSIELPDATRFFGEKSLRWVAGGLDGVFGGDSSSKEAQRGARSLFKLIKRAAWDPSEKRIGTLYNRLLQEHISSVVDLICDRVSEEDRETQMHVRSLAEWFIKSAPDRNPVKMGLGLLGALSSQDENKDLFLLFGMHEEFSVYSAAILQRISSDGEQTLWKLAQAVQGWGRDQIIYRLQETQNPKIKKWLVKEGCASTHDGSTTIICARVGELHHLLQQPDLENALFEGACSILDRLISSPLGHIHESIKLYPEGVEAVKLLLQHLEKRELGKKELGVSHFNVLKNILDFVNDRWKRSDWAELEALGWTAEFRKNLAQKIDALLEENRWKERILNGLKQKEHLAFWNASQAAQALGWDMWPYWYERIKACKSTFSEWFHLVQLTKEDRIDAVVELAEKLLPLQEIASGPGEELGVGEKYRAHQDLDSILQDLGKFPGKGIRLILAGLRSPVIRNRNFAIRALDTWGKAYFTDEIKSALKRALEEEPCKDVKTKLKEIIQKNG